MDNKDGIKKIMIAIMAVALIATVAVVISTGKKKPANKSGAGVSVSTADTMQGEDADRPFDTSITGVVTSIDEQEKEITIYSIKYEDKMIFSYNGATDIKNRYDKSIAISQVSIGQIFDAGYNSGNTMLISLKESKETWEYKNLSNFSFRQSGNVININDDKYKFTKGINITLDGVVIDKSKIIAGDEITARGIGNMVWSIVVTKSHGTVKFQNADNLIGGKVMIGNYDAVDIKKDTRLTVTEGIYTMKFVNGRLHGEKTVTVKRNQVITVDLSDVYMEPEDTALVNFKISPQTATLYVDGQLKSYSEPFELEYGEHTIKVEKDGYNTYSGRTQIKESGVTITINLTKEPEEEDDVKASDAPDKNDVNASDAPNKDDDVNASDATNEDEGVNASDAPGKDDDVNASDAANEDEGANASNNVNYNNSANGEDEKESPSYFADGSGGVG